MPGPFAVALGGAFFIRFWSTPWLVELFIFLLFLFSSASRPVLFFPAFICLRPSPRRARATLAGVAFALLLFRFLHGVLWHARVPIFVAGAPLLFERALFLDRLIDVQSARVYEGDAGFSFCVSLEFRLEPRQTRTELLRDLANRSFHVRARGSQLLYVLRLHRFDLERGY